MRKNSYVLKIINEIKFLFVSYLIDFFNGQYLRLCEWSKSTRVQTRSK